MKKLLFMFALFIGAVSANAQIATQNSNTLDNISVGVTVGATTPLDFNSVFPLNTNVGIKFQKDFTPSVGVQLEGLAFLNDNHFSDIKTMVKATNVGLNGVLNLSNALCGYNGAPRFFEVSAVGGIGWLHSWNTSNNWLTSKTGFDLAFNIGKKRANSIVLSPAIYWNLSKTSDVQFDKRFAQLGLNVSFVHHFMTSNGTHHFKTYDIGAMNDEINRLRGALDECHRQKPNTVEKIVERTKTVVVNENNEKWVVGFEFASDNLTDAAKFTLNQIGTNQVVDVVATASPEGTAEFNQKLSERRAKNVADYLTSIGVKVNSVIGKGVDATSGRTAIVTITKR